jgi:hypothetical protein
MSYLASLNWAVTAFGSNKRWHALIETLYQQQEIGLHVSSTSKVLKKLLICPKTFIFAKFKYGYQNNPEFYAETKKCEKIC